jgi:C1A family cysteine protease
MIKKFFEYIKHVLKIFFGVPAKTGGVRPQPLDERDLTYSPVGAIVDEIDFSKEMPPIKNQGDYESCSAHAIIAMLQYHNHRHLGIRYDELSLSEAYQWYWHRVVEERFPKNEGVFLRDGFKVIKKFGVVDHKYMPWTTHYASTPSHKALVAAAVARDLLVPKFVYQSVKGSGVRDAVLSGLPVVFGIGVGSSFLSLSKANYVVDQVGTVLFGHAMLIVGLRKIDGREFYVVRNSWGENWGLNGHCLMRRSFG